MRRDAFVGITAWITACGPGGSGGAERFAATMDASFVAGPPEALHGGWTLADSLGAPVDVSTLVGVWSLIGVGYTSCPDVCPATLTALPLLLDALTPQVPDGASLQVVFVAVDPERDAPNLEAYRAHFDPGDGVLRAWTGEPRALEALATDVGLAFTVDGTEVQHSTSWALVGPDGRVEGYVLHPTDPVGSAEGVGRALAASQPRWRSQGALAVEEPWFRPPPPGSGMGAAYVRLRSFASEPLRLVSAARADGTEVSVHETVVVNGLARMRPAEVAIPAGGVAELRSMGAHLMVPAHADRSSVDLRLRLDGGSSLSARFPSRGR